MSNPGLDSQNNKQAENFKDIEIKSKIDIFEILKLVSPGTPLRVVIDNLARARRGALIAVIPENFPNILEGGFKINCKFTPQRLFELCKMDGAVVLSKDLRKILYANVLLIPDSSIHTNETGTRHKAAERTAKQADTLVIAISEKKSTVTLYYGDTWHILRDTNEILGRATESLQILEKQREIYDEMITNLNILEITGLVSVGDVCSMLQRIEMIERIAEIIKKNLVELGREGSIVRIRLKELTKGVDKAEQFIIQDYANKPEKVKQLISKISFDDLIDIEGVSNLLFNRASNEGVHSKGYRFLKKTSLSDKDINEMISNFKNLNTILNLDTSSLMKIVKEEDFAKEFQKQIANLKEGIMIGKKL